MLDLYARLWQGEPLGDRDFVISADEKTSIRTFDNRDVLGFRTVTSFPGASVAVGRVLVRR